ncbi:hypothetical protein [Amycolatopsis sp. SID8362]|uniref:hypothetical protein n=1 Tax=Amycolatopsis sp. SID8362 TaxID=2690346 RepID=UPI00136B4FE0|nr:hypothetical protein [Amycolatopsis sp. SID8362]NBH08717.1 hypothetical protein [Amycolatopsis sp. SID8362]NED45411.1 hypothetical protein [Amycolatopsis sp. SID8362]
MAAGFAELATVITAGGIALGAVVRPFCRWLTARTFVSKARPEDIPEIAKALHPPIELKRHSTADRESSPPER